jgi:hypothetical protein
MADTYINPSGSISVGNTAGSGQSLNILKNFRTSTGVNVNTSVDFLRTFFRDKTQSTTDPRAYNRPMAFTGFRGGMVFRMDIVTFIDCPGRGPYHDRNEGLLQLRVTGGTGSLFNLYLSGPPGEGNRTISSGGIATWSQLGGTYGSNPRGTYSLLIADSSGVNISSTVTCYEAGGYGTSNILFEGIPFGSGSSFFNKGN